VKIKKITEDELDYVSVLCLDPSIGAKQREVMQDAMEDRTRWIRKMMKKGLEVLVALEEPKPERIHYKWAGDMLHKDLAVHGKVPEGLLESIPIEYAPEPVKGENQLFIDCMWILPPFWRTGVAKRLMESFIEKARKFGGASVLAYEGDKWCGTSLEYMPASFFERFGFKEVARDGSRVLFFLDFGVAKPPKLIHPKTEPSSEGNKIIVDLFCNSQCPWCRWTVDDIKRNTRKYPKVVVNIVKTDDRKIIEEFGMSRGVRINGKPVIKRTASWKEIKTEIEKTQR